jgi:arylformamidase
MNQIYRNFDRATLDREYNPASNIPNAAELHKKRREASRKTRETHRCSCDIPYGPSSGETLDIFFADKNEASIQLFFHGGSWRAQDKSNYSFLAEPLVHHGITALIVNYGLCPSVTLDEIIQQCNASIAWAYTHAKVFGGDPNRISICGHSAGAQIAMRTLETDWSQFGRVPDDVIKAAGAVSGIYDLEAIRLSSTNNDVRLDQEQSLRNSPMFHPLRRRVPLVLSTGDKDNEEFQRQTKDFAAALGQKSYDFDYVVAEGHNHFSILDAMTDPNDPLGNKLLNLAKSAGDAA